MNIDRSPRDGRPAETSPSAGRSRALVLSGGGALGALQAGFLRALFRTSYRPSLIIGTSAGALNGAFLSFFPDADGAERLAEIWLSLRDRRLFMFNPARVVYQIVSRQLCLANSKLLTELIRHQAPEDDFAATKVPLYITTTNLTQGCKSVFHDGPVSRAVLASTALPGIFCPVEIEGSLYVDGGVLANLDLDIAVELGADDILAVDLSRCVEGTRPDDIPSLWSQTLDIMQRERVERDVERLASRARITLVQPGVESPVSLSNLADVNRLLEQGERLGEQVLASYVEDDGRFRAGTIHAPLHIHPFREPAPGHTPST